MPTHNEIQARTAQTMREHNRNEVGLAANRVIRAADEIHEALQGVYITAPRGDVKAVALAILRARRALKGLDAAMEAMENEVHGMLAYEEKFPEPKNGG